MAAATKRPGADAELGGFGGLFDLKAAGYSDPLLIAATDGTRIGVVLDRNGLRPFRYLVTKNDLLVMASEVGVLDIPPEEVRFKERLHPGRMFLLDTNEARIIDDEEFKQMKKEILG